MFKWISNLFKPTPDKIEERLLSLFDFLMNTYGFSYSKEELGNAVDKNGKFITCLEFHTKNCNVVKFGKEFAFIASACNNLVIWIPSKKGKKEIYK